MIYKNSYFSDFIREVTSFKFYLVSPIESSKEFPSIDHIPYFSNEGNPVFRIRLTKGLLISDEDFLFPDSTPNDLKNTTELSYLANQVIAEITMTLCNDSVVKSLHILKHYYSKNFILLRQLMEYSELSDVKDPNVVRSEILSLFDFVFECDQNTFDHFLSNYAIDIYFIYELILSLSRKLVLIERIILDVIDIEFGSHGSEREIIIKKINLFNEVEHLNDLRISSVRRYPDISLKYANQELNHKVIALFHSYMSKANDSYYIDAENCDYVASQYGYVAESSGLSIKNDFNHYHKPDNRIATYDNKRGYSAHCDRFECVLKILEEKGESHTYQSAMSEFNSFKDLNRHMNR